MSKKNMGLLVFICGIVAFAITTFAVWLSQNYAFGQQDYFYEGGQAYDAGDCQLSVDQVSSIEIDWLSGNVTIERYQGENIKIVESGAPARDDDKFHYHLNNNGYLQIKYFSSRQSAGIYHKVQNKDLVIKIPEAVSLEDIEITVTTGNIMLNEISVEDKLYLTAVTGNVSMEDSTVNNFFCDITIGDLIDRGSIIQEINVGVVTGNISMDGVYSTFDGGIQTGDLTLSLTKTNQVKAEISTGNLRITLPKESGFVARYLVDSGNISFGQLPVEYKSSTEAVCGDGTMEMILTVMTGDIVIGER